MDDKESSPSVGVWAVPAVSTQPELLLRRWAVFEIKPRSTRHLVGYNASDREGRVSSAIQEFDPLEGICATTSGRVYRLLGCPGYDEDGLYVWARWCAMQFTPVESFEDVTAEYAFERPSQ